MYERAHTIIFMAVSTPRTPRGVRVQGCTGAAVMTRHNEYLWCRKARAFFWSFNSAQVLSGGPWSGKRKIHYEGYSCSFVQFCPAEQYCRPDIPTPHPATYVSVDAPSVAAVLGVAPAQGPLLHCVVAHWPRTTAATVVLNSASSRCL